jgi:hypothetical protein
VLLFYKREPHIGAEINSTVAKHGGRMGPTFCICFVPSSRRVLLIVRIVDKVAGRIRVSLLSTIIVSLCVLSACEPMPKPDACKEQPRAAPAACVPRDETKRDKQDDVYY